MRCCPTTASAKEAITGAELGSSRASGPAGVFQKLEGEKKRNGSAAGPDVAAGALGAGEATAAWPGEEPSPHPGAAIDAATSTTMKDKVARDARARGPLRAGT